MIVTVEVSLYPIGQGDFRAVDAAIEALRAAGLEPEVRPMHSDITGDAEVIFPALARAFSEAARFGGAVMHVTVSNSCPT